jgi:hypothetical protein
LSRSIGGTAASSFSWLSDSDPRTTQVLAGFLAATNGSWSSTASTGFGFRQSESVDQRSGNESWAVSLSHSAYPWARPLGFAVSVNATGSYAQIWRHDQAASDQVTGNSTIQLSAIESWFYQTSIHDAAQLRFGRVRNATGVYDARVLEQRLREMGALSHPLSAEARRRLIALMYLRYDYDAFRERSGKSLWERVEEMLREDGAIADSGVDARAIQRAGESEVSRAVSPDGLPRSPVLRLTGGYFAGEITDQHRNFLARTDASLSAQQILGGVPQPPITGDFNSRSEQPFDLVMAGGVARYDRPLGDRWPLRRGGRVWPLRPRLTASGQLQRRGDVLVSDRWFATLYWFKSRSVRRDADTDHAGRFVAGQYGRRHVVPRGSSAARGGHHRLPVQSGAPNFGFNSPSSTGPSKSPVALTYRFMGSFAAPGLWPPRISPAALTSRRYQWEILVDVRVSKADVQRLLPMKSVSTTSP